MLKLPDTEKSFWREAYPETPIYPRLTKDMETDVAIIGAGITGLTTAYLLKQAGLRVIVLEKHTVGGGTTGRSTGKVTSQHGIFYAGLQERLGTKVAQAYAEANQTAIKQVEANIQRENIDCDWQRGNNYVFTTENERVPEFENEAKIAHSLSLPASFQTRTPLPFEVKGALLFTNQAKMSAQKYVLGLARAINDDVENFIFEKSTVIAIREGNPANVRTRSGTVTAKHIIVASSVPTLPLAARASYGLLEAPSETYAVAGPLEKELPDMYISPDKDHYSILPITVGGKSMLLIVGEGHFWGLRTNRHARFQRLADYAEKYFGVTNITHRWSERDYTAYDGVPLVGKLYPWSENVYVGTGFKKWGLSNGTVAGMILRDLITGKPNAWASTYDSTRITPIKSIPNVIVNNVRKHL